MSTSYKSPPNPQEPEQLPPAIKIRRKVTPARQYNANANSHATPPVLKAKPAGKLPTSAHTPGTSSEQGPVPSQQQQGRAILSEPEIQDGQIVLHHSTNFYVRTTNRHGRKPNPLRRRSGHTMLVPRVVPEQEKRIASSATRLLPQVEPVNTLKTSSIPLPAWAEALVVVLVLLATLVAHAFNVFYFPHYELDEGTYMSNAWAIIHGMMEPYPYGYGHPPVGWIQIAVWIQLTGGFFTFGNALNSGRVLMLFYALGSSLLVYLIIRRMEASRTAALLAMLIFSLSPLSLVYQRQVLLDNIGTFWLLLSLYLLVIGNSRLPYIVSAAFCFGIAVLSKEIFIIFIPVMIYAVCLHTTSFQRKFALVAFIYTMVASGSAFVLMAVLKGELLPPNILPWDNHPHLSLLSTYFSQVQRSQSEGSFDISWREWTHSDFLMVTFSLGATLFNLVAGWWNRKRLCLALLAITFWILLARGGVVFPFYFIPMIPLVAFNAATTISTVTKWLGQLTRLELVRVILLFTVIISIIFYDTRQAITYTSQRPTEAETSALLWIRNRVPQNSLLVINSYFFTDLREPGGEGVGNGAIYPYAHIYWNVAYDPEIHDALLQNDWQRIDYIVTDPDMLRDIKTRGGEMSILDQALNHSILRTEFQAQDRDQQVDIRIYQVLHQQVPSVVYQTAPANTSRDLFC